MLRPESLNRHLQFQLLSVSAQALYFVILNKRKLILFELKVNDPTVTVIAGNKRAKWSGLRTRKKEGLILWKMIPMIEARSWRAKGCRDRWFLVFDHRFREESEYLQKSFSDNLAAFWFRIFWRAPNFRFRCWIFQLNGFIWISQSYKPNILDNLRNGGFSGRSEFISGIKEKWEANRCGSWMHLDHKTRFNKSLIHLLTF